MKKLFFSVFMISGMFFAIEANAQYIPSKDDVGKDCTTQDGKLGRWKEVTVTEKQGNDYGQTSSTSVSGGGSLGSSNIGSVSASGAYSNSNSRGSSKSEEISYDDIRCVEDKNAKLPQQTPARW